MRTSYTTILQQKISTNPEKFFNNPEVRDMLLEAAETHPHISQAIIGAVLQNPQVLEMLLNAVLVNSHQCIKASQEHPNLLNNEDFMQSLSSAVTDNPQMSQVFASILAQSILKDDKEFMTQVLNNFNENTQQAFTDAMSTSSLKNDKHFMQSLSSAVTDNPQMSQVFASILAQSILKDDKEFMTQVLNNFNENTQEAFIDAMCGSSLKNDKHFMQSLQSVVTDKPQLSKVFEFILRDNPLRNDREFMTQVLNNFNKNTQQAFTDAMSTSSLNNDKEFMKSLSSAVTDNPQMSQVFASILAESTLKDNKEFMTQVLNNFNENTQQAFIGAMCKSFLKNDKDFMQSLSSAVTDNPQMSQVFASILAQSTLKNDKEFMTQVLDNFNENTQQAFTDAMSTSSLRNDNEFMTTILSKSKDNADLLNSLVSICYVPDRREGILKMTDILKGTTPDTFNRALITGSLRDNKDFMLDLINQFQFIDIKQDENKYFHSFCVALHLGDLKDDEEVIQKLADYKHFDSISCDEIINDALEQILPYSTISSANFAKRRIFHAKVNEQKIGEGSYGTVYERKYLWPKDNEVRSSLAVKTFRPDTSNTKELNGTSISGSPYFPKMYEATLGEQRDSGLNYPTHRLSLNTNTPMFFSQTQCVGKIIMECIPGTTLNNFIKTNLYNPDISKDTWKHIGTELCTALKEMHAVGIAHYDTEFGRNTMVYLDEKSKKYVIKMIDFGLSIRNVANTEGFLFDVNELTRLQLPNSPTPHAQEAQMAFLEPLLQYKRKLEG